MILEGEASEILHDYVRGRYTLVADQTGYWQFEDGYGVLWELPVDVQYYLDIIETK